MRRFGSFLVVTAWFVFTSTAANALSCWQCEPNRQTCDYYMQTALERCVEGCRRMGFTSDEDDCHVDCGEEAWDRDAQCLEDRSECYRICSSTGSFQRPWYIPY